MPASSSAIAIEYGSSPVEHGRLSSAKASAGVGGQPFFVNEANERGKRRPVSEEPGLGYDDGLNQRLQLGAWMRERVPGTRAASSTLQAR